MRRPHLAARAAARALAICLALAPAVALGAGAHPQQSAVYYVAVDGSDDTGDGSLRRPWATLWHAAEAIPDASAVVVVDDGTYETDQGIARRFSSPVAFRAANLYRARFVNRSAPAALDLSGSNYSVSGFDLRGGSSSLVSIGRGGANAIQLRDNILTLGSGEDGSSAALVVAGGATDIVIEGNLITGAAERPLLGNGTAAQVFVGNSQRAWLHANIFVGAASATELERPAVLASASQGLAIDGNVFLGPASGPVVHVSAMDGPEFPPTRTRVDNNLFVGAGRPPAAPILAMDGARDVLFRANTVIGPLGAEPFALSLAAGPGGATNANVGLYNNIFSDPTGRMGDFASGPVTSTLGLELHNNLYWNGGRPIPSVGDGPSVADDPAAIVADPLLPAATVVPPVWDPETGTFGGGHRTIREVFASLAELARTAPGSPAIDRADGDHMPLTDLAGRPRGSPDIGALEHRPPPPPTPTATATPAARIYLPRNAKEAR